ncbi:MAG: efflux RND transporter permease subunit [Planctomycetaceae bacterium]|jgi:HAE1 family hydrophobic/amphiphilic exporter-1|nr:efflux RND transporter permease subunit [Planctomycetaceae bacterium]
MDIIKFSIDNPVKVAVGVLLTILFGVLAFVSVPVQMTPDVERPVVTIRTTWQGRSPEEVEKSILMEQEKKLKTLQGLYQMTSTAQLGEGRIELEFTVGYDMSRAVQETSNRLNEVPRYPDDVERPVIRAASANTDEAIAFGLFTSENNPEFEMAEFYDYADRYVKPAFERIKGLAQVDVYGGREHEVQVRFDPVVLAQAGISVDELRSAIMNDNLNESAGDLSNGRQDIRFRVLGRYDSLEPIRNVIVKYIDGAPIYLKDIATPCLALKKNTYFNQSMGRTSMSMYFRRDTGANVLSIMQEVNRIGKEISKPGGLLDLYKNDRYQIKFELLYDDSLYINNAVALVKQNMYEGGILAIVVLLLFLRSFRPTLIISIAIPISIVGTFVVLYAAGRNINVISLAGLAFAIGMVVDCAIVVLENIDRHLHMGQTVLVAAYEGTKEVWGAVLAQTLTTVAVFCPVLTIQEESGQLFYDIAIAVSASVLISLLVAITVIPVCAVNWLREKPKQHDSQHGWYGWLYSIIHSLFGLAPICQKLSNGFAHLVYLLTFRSLSGIWVRLVIIAFISGAATFLSFSLMPPASYLPTGNKNVLNGNMLLPPAYSIQQNVLVGRRAEEFLRPYWEAQTVAEASAIQEIVDTRTNKVVPIIPPIKSFYIVVRNQGVFMNVTSKDDDLVKPLEVLLNSMMNAIPGCSGNAQQQGIFGRRGGGSNSVQIEVIGSDMQRLRDSTNYLEQRLVGVFSRAGVRSEPANYDLNGPEWEIIVDQVRAKELGLSVQSLAYTSRAMIDGIYVGDFDYEGDNIDLTLIRDPDIPLTPDEFETLPISIIDNDGKRQLMPVGQLVSFAKADASQQIRRVEQERAIRLTVSPPSDVALETAQAQILQIVEESHREGGMTPDTFVKLSGNADKLSQTRRAMLGQWTGLNSESVLNLIASRFFLSLLITYLLMAGLFESFLYPFVIMFSVPFAMVGGFIGLAIINHYDPTQQMDTLTMLGFVLLIGVVVNNAILLVHQTLNFMKGRGESETDIIEKMNYREAIREAVRTRIRPIFMTTAAAVIGMVPLVIKSGAGSELYRGIGSVVIGGLVCSTLFSLFVVPLMLSLVIDIQFGLFRLLGNNPPDFTKE